jgi:flavin-dependent dehydrogenase
VRRLMVLWLVGLLLAANAQADAPSAFSSYRRVPLAYSVDVLVVGGSTGAVAAAVAAAKSGASVFLAAPRHYLGDDVTATLRLWLEPDENPTSELARAVYCQLPGGGPSPFRVPMTYSADLPSGGVHPDTTPPSLLTDGAWGTASTQSVQYNGEVSITGDLQSEQALTGARVVVYQGKDYRVDAVEISTSMDGKQWTPVATLRNEAPWVPESDDQLCFTLQGTFSATARYVRLDCRMPQTGKRVLLGEVEVLGHQNLPGAAALVPPTPLQVKRALDDALLAAGVQFLYGCHPTDVLRDGAGRPCGIVMANRVGRQAVVARTIIDATNRATVARLAGAQFRSYPAGMHTFRRTVIGGKPRTAPGMTHRVIDPAYRGPFPNAQKTSSGVFPIIEYTLRLPMADGGVRSFIAADQKARTLTYDPEQQFTSDTLFEVPPDPMVGLISCTGPWQGPESLLLEAFRPAGVPSVYVLGGCADVSRAQAAELLRPLALMDLGTRVGAAAAEEARHLPRPAGVRVPGQAPVRIAVPGDLREMLQGVRPVGQPRTLPQASGPVPVIGSYDVVVVGGGTAGAPAGIAAARVGAKTLVVEMLSGLGGVGTLGAIPTYCAGNRVGFTKTVQADTKNPNLWVIEQRMEWWRQELLKARADVWFGVTGCGVLRDGNRVVGVEVATPAGRGVVRAKVVVDATGNADVAAAAGAETLYTDSGEFGVQGSGLPGMRLGGTVVNTDYAFTDETDLVDMWQLFVFARRKFEQSFDTGQLVDTRERRRIMGDFTMSFVDQMVSRTFPDTVAQAKGGAFDTHGYTTEDHLLLYPAQTAGLITNIPYRCMLPRGLDGLIVTGLGMSMTRDAVPLIRMQPDIQNAGYAAGAAAAMAANNDVGVREIDIPALQRHLVMIGNLKPEVLGQRDSLPVSDRKLLEAVDRLPKDPVAAAVVLSDPQRALPMIRQAMFGASGDERLSYAAMLGMLGDATGSDDLLGYVWHNPWDEGQAYSVGMGKWKLSMMDSRIIALGRTKDPRAVPVILEKLRQLDEKGAFSHFRACALGLDALRAPGAAQALAQALALPGVRGHDEQTVQDAIEREVLPGAYNVVTREATVRELLLARALYRCGDWQGVGKATLQAYATDLRGHLARHASAVLQEEEK